MMTFVWIGAGGVAAHAASFLLAQYGHWLLTKVVQGEQRFRFVDDLKQFVRWLLQGLTERLADRQGWAFVERDW